MLKWLKRVLCLHLREKRQYFIRSELLGQYECYYKITRHYCPSCKKRWETKEWLLNLKLEG